MPKAQPMNTYMHHDLDISFFEKSLLTTLWNISISR